MLSLETPHHILCRGIEVAEGTRTKRDGDTFWSSQPHSPRTLSPGLYVCAELVNPFSGWDWYRWDQRHLKGCLGEGFLLMKFGGPVNDSDSTWAPGTICTLELWPLTRLGRLGVPRWRERSEVVHVSCETHVDRMPERGESWSSQVPPVGWGSFQTVTLHALLLPCSLRTSHFPRDILSVRTPVGSQTDRLTEPVSPGRCPGICIFNELPSGYNAYGLLTKPGKPLSWTSQPSSHEKPLPEPSSRSQPDTCNCLPGPNLNAFLSSVGALSSAELLPCLKYMMASQAIVLPPSLPCQLSQKSRLAQSPSHCSLQSSVPSCPLLSLFAGRRSLSCFSKSPCFCSLEAL